MGSDHKQELEVIEQRGVERDIKLIREMSMVGTNRGERWFLLVEQEDAQEEPEDVPVVDVEDVPANAADAHLAHATNQLVVNIF